MSSTTPKEFVDFEGLSYFWGKVQETLQTTVDGHRPGTYRVPPGKQVSSILQEKGIVKVSFGEFGGPDKEAARESLGVMSAEEVDEKLAAEFEARTEADIALAEAILSAREDFTEGLDTEREERIAADLALQEQIHDSIIEVDSALDPESRNPVENRVVDATFKSVDAEIDTKQDILTEMTDSEVDSLIDSLEDL